MLLLCTLVVAGNDIVVDSMTGCSDGVKRQTSPDGQEAFQTELENILRIFYSSATFPFSNWKIKKFKNT